MKLIIINGSPAAGKSTLAQRLHQELPLSLLADIDSWRRLVSGYRENRKESLEITYKFAVAAIDAYLQTGHDVIVDKAILGVNDVLDAIVESGQKYGAEIYEFVLTADKDVIIQRAAERGFRDAGLLTPEKVVELWDRAQDLIQERPNAVVIDTNTLDAEAIYKKVKGILLKE